MKIIERIFNAETGETVDIERDETAQEKTNREAFEVRIAEEQAQTAAKEAARQVILDKLGLTVEEAKLLLG